MEYPTQGVGLGLLELSATWNSGYVAHEQPKGPVKLYKGLHVEVYLRYMTLWDHDIGNYRVPIQHLNKTREVPGEPSTARHEGPSRAGTATKPLDPQTLHS